MGFFNFNKKQPVTQEVKDTRPIPQMFSTPFMTVGKGNLSSPEINTYYMQNGYVPFGIDNLYPQLLEQLFFQSPLHGAIIDYITDSVIGGGFNWVDKNPTMKQQVSNLAFEKRVKLKKLIAALTRDYVIHRRVTVKVIKSDSGIVTVKRIDPAYIRNSRNLERFVYSTDWSKGMIESKEYLAYDSKLKESLYVYQEDSPGQDVYPIPTYNSCLNWAFLDSEISYFHKNNIQNSVFPSIVIRRPKEFGSIDEVNQFKAEIANKTGAANSGKVVVLTGNGMDDVPEFESISVNGNDKLFEASAREVEDQICKAHKINPLLMGIKVSGSLGNSTELEFGYAIYEKVVVMPLRNTMEEIINDLIDICGIKSTIKIENYQIIDKQIEKTTK